MKKWTYNILFISVLGFHISLPLYAKEDLENSTIPTTNKFYYTVQKYTGFNTIVDFFTESILKTIIKHKTHAKTLDVDLEIYSGWDLIRKKAQSLQIKGNYLSINGIPIDYIELETKGPIYFKKEIVNEKTGKKRNSVQIPIKLLARIEIDLTNVSKALNNLPKWQKVFKELDLPIPPFGSTKVALNNLNISINAMGGVTVSSSITSTKNRNSAPLNLIFKGILKIENERIIISDLQSEVRDIFTKNSDIGRSFSKLLKDLINPIFSFHKYEKKGLKIEHVDMLFKPNKLILIITSKLIPTIKKRN